MESISGLNNPNSTPNIIEKDYALANLSGLPSTYFKENRERFFNKLLTKYSDIEKNSVLILKGGREIPRYDTDTVNYHFTQESNFYYLTGVVEPNFLLVIHFSNLTSELFMEVPDIRTKTFMHVPTLDDVEKKYGLKCTDDKSLVGYLKSLNLNKIFTPKGTNTDSGNNFDSFELDEDRFPLIKGLYQIYEQNSQIYELLADTRVVKSINEISVMNFTVKVTVDAHIEVMKNVKPGLIERDIENIFYEYLRTNFYSREMAYPPICGCGINGATLHYGKNDSDLLDGSLLLVDMGFQLGGYCSDLTSTIPINGKFSDIQKTIYDIVLDANRTVMKHLKAGANWLEMHILAERVLLAGLQGIGIINSGFSIEELLESRICFYFMPHGLGHLIGLDVHDAGGYLSFTQPRSTEPGKRSLRTSRILEAGTMITVEPGLYFIEFHLENALKDEKLVKYLNAEKLRTFYKFGGIRIEDVVLVQEEGCFNLSKDLPRATEQIETIMTKI